MLRDRVFSAVRWTALAALGRSAIQILQVLVLANLLGPEEFGLVSLVTIVIALVSLVSDLGLNTAFVQAAEVDQVERSSIFWLNLALAAAIGLGLVLLADAVAALFRKPELAPLLALAAASIPIAALSQQLRNSAQKELRFARLTLVELAGVAFTLAVSVALALQGLGALSVVLGTVAGAGLLTALSWAFLRDGWRPSARFDGRCVGRFLAFGIPAAANNLVGYLANSVDIVVGGRVLPAQELGAYTLPRNLVFQVQNIINPIATRVALPVFARLQDDLDRARGAFLTMLRFTSSVNAPLYVGLFFFSEELVMVALGPDWALSVATLHHLAIWGYVRSVGNPTATALLGLGRSALLMVWGIARLLITTSIVFACSAWGVTGLNAALLIVTAVTFLPIWYFLTWRPLGVPLGRYAWTMLTPALIAVAAILPVHALLRPVESDPVRLILGAAAAMAAYAGLSLAFNRTWTDAMWRLVAGRDR